MVLAAVVRSTLLLPDSVLKFLCVFYIPRLATSETYLQNFSGSAYNSCPNSRMGPRNMHFHKALMVLIHVRVYELQLNKGENNVSYPNNNLAF